MLHFIVGDYGAAVGRFQEAFQIQRGPIVQEAMAESRRAMELYRQSEAQELATSEQTAARREQREAKRDALAERKAADAQDNSIEAQLLRLKGLLDKGLISKDVYDQQSAEIVAAGMKQH